MKELEQFIVDNFSTRELAELIVRLYHNQIDTKDIDRFVDDCANEMKYENEKAEEIWHDMQATYRSLERF